jgi:TolB-like protein/Tfp pilus assembly protein PilF
MDVPTRADMFLFEDFRLDRGGLSRRDQSGNFVPVPIGSRALEILAVLVARPGDLVTRDEIIKEVWPATNVEYSNIAVQIASLRRVLDPGRPKGSLIQTVSGRGYRFAGAVGRAPPAVTPSLLDKPSIAVLPFTNMGGEPEQEYFVDGMVEEIITALSRIRWLLVIARNSTFTYKGQPIDVNQVGRELGVRYVLEGSVRRAGGRVRVTAQLIDAAGRTHLWADRFEGSLEDVFDLQDKIAFTVAGVIEPTLQAAETARSRSRPTTDLTAYDLFLRALAHSLSYQRDQLTQALDLLQQAIERDPHYGPALALAAHVTKAFEVMNWTGDPEAVRLKSVALARQALRVGPDDPDVLALAAFTFGYFGEDIDVATSLMDRCLTLNPSHAPAWHWSGLLRIFAGQPESALNDFENYLRLSPRDRLASYLNGIGEAYFFCRRFEEAAANLLGSLERAPGFPITYRVLASCYAHTGRLDDAREIVTRLRAITPTVMEPGTRYRNPELRELFLSGLRRAAGEST